ncbi:MAG: histidinol dehydrogenase [Actinobacteria bacterium]|nr:histidinol dehydrogenase [Actinomycetota bacterium]
MQLKRHNLTVENIPGLVASLRGVPGEDEGLRDRVGAIINSVRRGGDLALVELTREYDCPDFQESQLRVPSGEIEAAASAAPQELMEALKMAAENIRLFHQHEMRGSWTASMRHSQMLGQRMIPVDRAGLYVPGGAAAYPSTVLMTVIPAQVAGVKEIFICTPPSADGQINQAVLAAAGMLGVKEIYRVGGAQAIAAMAYGTGTIGKSDVIAGPGNIYVTEAKRQVYGRVGLDSLAGPSEVVIIASASAQPDLAAIDLLAQVEHGSGAIAVLVCPSSGFADAAEEQVFRLAGELGIGEDRLGNISIVIGSDTGFIPMAIAFSNAFAPEHLQIHTEHPEQEIHEITAAGAVFLGEDVCTAYGDYVAGSNHVLPTAGTARFGSALSVENFLRKVAVISLIPTAITELTPSLMAIARAEGLTAHARAAQMRLERFGLPVDDDED